MNIRADAPFFGRSLWQVRTASVLDGLAKLPDGCVHTCVTSPPYWGLRDYQTEGQLGLEPALDEYIANQVAVFGEVRRVLRADGTLWLNIGDTYASRGGPGAQGIHGAMADRSVTGARRDRHRRDCGQVKPKDMVGVPWLLAFALRADGWYLRSEIIWHKRSPMPESVRDRPTKAHEQIFLLSKSPQYYYDHVASAEPASERTHDRSRRIPPKAQSVDPNSPDRTKQNGSMAESTSGLTSTRNMRSVWTLSTEALKEAHFAAYPTELVRRCLLAATSERGCCATCGAPHVRRTEQQRVATRPGTGAKRPDGWATHPGKHETVAHNTPEGAAQEKAWKADQYDSIGQRGIGSPNRDPRRHVTRTVTVGWQPGCECLGSELTGALVLDPYCGSGTTGIVARRLGCRFLGLEINPDYAELARRRIVDDAPLLNQ